MFGAAADAIGAISGREALLICMTFCGLACSAACGRTCSDTGCDLCTPLDPHPHPIITPYAYRF